MARDSNLEQPYSMRELRRLLEAPLRRPLLVVVPLALVLGAAVAASHLLPPRYSSSTLILVAPDPMPDSLVQQMNTERIARRLQTLRQEVQSRTRLEMVARELDPYGIIATRPLMHTLDQMRGAITVSVKGNDAFTIEFEHTDPKMAMLVADRLTTLFMEEVVGSRERQVATAYQFIESQLQDARAELEKKEQALREYKERYMGGLPQQVNSNLATLQRLQLQHQTISESLRSATDRLLLLEAGAESVSAGATPAPEDPLAALRAQLVQLLARYTHEHPDVRALQARIASLEKAMAERAAAQSAAAAGMEAPPDPTAARVERQILEARRDVAVLNGRLGEVEGRIAAFQARVEAAPRREQELVSLTRDYDKLNDNYSKLLTKKLEAEMAARLEQEAKGHQFRILDPAYLPEQPSFPNRSLFALAGAVAGLLLGIGLSVAVDFLDPAVKDVEDLQGVLDYPVLAVMPYLSRREQRRLARRSDVNERVPGVRVADRDSGSVLRRTGGRGGRP